MQDIIKQCGSLFADALTLGAMSRAAEREALEMKAKQAFPDDWELLLDTMVRFDKASFSPVSPYIKQMWAHGICPLEELWAVYERCPYPFKDESWGELVGHPASEVLPRLAAKLP